MARPHTPQPDSGWRKIVGVIAVVAGLLLALSMWTGGAAGQVGQVVYQGVRWGFGLPGLALPVVVVGLGLVQFHPRVEAEGPRITVGALGTLIGVAGLWHIWSGVPGRQLGAEAMRASGGVIGATASVWLSELFSVVGAGLILVIGTALALMALTNTSFSQIGQWVRRVVDQVEQLWAMWSLKRAEMAAAKAERDARFAREAEEAAAQARSEAAIAAFDAEDRDPEPVERTLIAPRNMRSNRRDHDISAQVESDFEDADPLVPVRAQAHRRHQDDRQATIAPRGTNRYHPAGDEDDALAMPAFVTDFGDDPEPAQDLTVDLAAAQAQGTHPSRPVDRPTVIERSYRPCGSGRTRIGTIGEQGADRPLDDDSRYHPDGPDSDEALGLDPDEVQRQGVHPPGSRVPRPGRHNPNPVTRTRPGRPPRPPRSPEADGLVGDVFADDDEALLARINGEVEDDPILADQLGDQDAVVGEVLGWVDEDEDGDDVERAELEADGDDLAIKLVPRDEADYVLPPVTMLEIGHAAPDNHESLERMQLALAQMLEQFGVDAQIVAIRRGPTVTRFELELGVGVKVAAITKLDRDIAYALATPDVRIVAPIPGKVAIGIEVPNEERDFITLGDILMSDVADQVTHPLGVALGLDIGGRPVMINLAKMPHLLIAGATGSGKSVVMNGIVTSLIMRNTPKEVRMILIDPKQVEMAIYEDVPHLLTRVVTDPKRAKDALDWLVDEMERRYGLLRDYKVRHLDTYNEKVDEDAHLPYIVCIIDELADLMMVAKNDVETAIVRIAQKARAVGIHLVIATQRPSVNVVTGLIKANVPSRIALSMATGHDSKTILDQYGAEKLIGQGDMLYMPANVSKPHRLQGSYVDEREIEAIVAFCKDQAPVVYESNIIKEGSDAVMADVRGEDATDEDLTRAAMDLVVRSGLGSTSMLQRKLQIGFARAGRIMDELERMGVVGPSEGPKARVVLMTVDQLEDQLF